MLGGAFSTACCVSAPHRHKHRHLHSSVHWQISYFHVLYSLLLNSPSLSNFFISVCLHRTLACSEHAGTALPLHTCCANACAPRCLFGLHQHHPTHRVCLLHQRACTRTVQHASAICRENDHWHLSTLRTAHLHTRACMPNLYPVHARWLQFFFLCLKCALQRVTGMGWLVHTRSSSNCH